VICSHHFSDSAYVCPHLRNESGTRLLGNACPTLNLYKDLPAPSKRPPPRMREQPSIVTARKHKCTNEIQTDNDEHVTDSLPEKPGRGRKRIHYTNLAKKVQAERRKATNLAHKISLLKSRYALLQRDNAKLQASLRNCWCKKVNRMSKLVNEFIFDQNRNSESVQ
jgi:hypothetical protein